MHQAEQAERARRQAEADLVNIYCLVFVINLPIYQIELREAVNDLSNQVNSLNGYKRKLEGELQALHVNLFLDVHLLPFN